MRYGADTVRAGECLCGNMAYAQPPAKIFVPAKVSAFTLEEPSPCGQVHTIGSAGDNAFGRRALKAASHLIDPNPGGSRAVARVIGRLNDADEGEHGRCRCARRDDRETGA